MCLKILYKSFLSQHHLFILLWTIGIIGEAVLIAHHPAKYACYLFPNRRLTALRPASGNRCSDLTNLPCSLQMQIDIYFFWSKCLFLYFMSIIICMIYAWHRTVRCSHCIVTISILGDIIFHIDLVVYFDRIAVVAPFVCLISLLTFSILDDLMPNESPDPLLSFCKQIASPVESDEILNGRSKCAQFYQWTKKMKQKWGIQEEKLIFTLISAIVTNGLMICCLFLCPYLFGADLLG